MRYIVTLSVTVTLIARFWLTPSARGEATPVQVTPTAAVASAPTPLPFKLFLPVVGHE